MKIGQDTPKLLLNKHHTGVRSSTDLKFKLKYNRKVNTVASRSDSSWKRWDV